MDVRSATNDDAARIAEIHVRSWQVAYRGLLPDHVLDNLSVSERTESWIRRLEREPSTVLVASNGDVVVGWLGFGQSRDDDASSSVAEVFGLYVDPDAWRLGAGSLLWRDARRRILADGFASATLWVVGDNSRARAFYESVGFDLEAGQARDALREGAVLPQVRYRWRGEKGDGSHRIA